MSSIKADHGLEAMAHFTCVGATVAELREMLDVMRDAGIQNVLALRGDPPPGETEWTATEGGLEYSRELIELIRDDYDFAIGAACFPEVHIHADSAESDLRYCKEKVDAGARFLITQLFFDNAIYWDFVARAREIGIDVPIIPGIMPITNYDQIRRFTSMCGATIPDHLLRELGLRADQPDAVPTSASPTRPSSAPTCSPRARPGSTSTRSTAPPPRARSSARCASWRPGGTPCRPRHGAPPSDLVTREQRADVAAVAPGSSPRRASPPSGRSCARSARRPTSSAPTPSRRAFRRMTSTPRDMSIR